MTNIPQELPDGRRYCSRCKKYKGASFFAPCEWKRPAGRSCCACQKEDNERFNERHKIRSGGADVKRKSFSVKFKDE